MRHGEEELQKLTVRDLLRIERDLHRFRMAGRLGADHLIVRGRRLAARIAGDDLRHSANMLEHPLQSPEAAAGEHSDLRSIGFGGGCVECGARDRSIDGLGAKAAAKRQGDERNDK